MIGLLETHKLSHSNYFCYLKSCAVGNTVDGLLECQNLFSGGNMDILLRFNEALLVRGYCIPWLSALIAVLIASI